MNNLHLWQGEWINNQELENRLKSIQPFKNPKLDLSIVLEATHRMSQELKSKGSLYENLREPLIQSGTITLDEVDATLDEIADFLARETLTKKIVRELGSNHPFLPVRISYTDSLFEAWAPLGLLVHVASQNSFSVGPMSVVEGLLSGNLNFLKSSGSESLFPLLFLDALGQLDPTGVLRNFIIATRISSHQKEWLRQIFAQADGIAVWGGEEAVQAVKEMAPPSTRIVDWGHKISLAYVSERLLGNDQKLEKVLTDLAKECCLLEQRACSSPQCIYVEVESRQELESFGRRFARVLEGVSASIPRVEPTREEAAEITLVTELCKQESSLDLTQVIESAHHEWRILLDSRSTLQASPLYRTVWIKPLKRSEICSTLWPMRHYLQTIGLACDLLEVSELSHIFLNSGAVRIRRLGEMLGSYSGEAHDGVYALQRYCKKISVQLGEEAVGISNFADLTAVSPPQWLEKPPILRKTDFPSVSEDASYARLFFKSGGSTGKPKLSVFSYSDYHEQMRAGAEGLYAAGLDPSADRCMNLFFSGGLYGGFISFFSVLEDLGAIQFPMSAHLDFRMVAESIVQFRVNVLLGMPSYLMQLFEQEHEILKSYRGIQKIFYGGEHFLESQRRYLQETFGIELIQSAGYGSVDTGPLGYCCRMSSNGVHHVHQRLQYLEIVDLETDTPTQGESIGRLIFTSKVRSGLNLDRYELGDVGHWLLTPCPCGRTSPRFKLLGRVGDIFRIGSVFLNYQKFAQIISERTPYAGELQIILTQEGLKEKLIVQIAKENTIQEKDISCILLENYKDLRDAVIEEKVLDFQVMLFESGRFRRTRGSGKLIRILDERGQSL